jgi:hypothetical protein
MIEIPRHKPPDRSGSARTTQSQSDLTRLVYVSRSNLACDLWDPLTAVRSFVQDLARRHGSHAISGLMLFNGDYFAQALEGRTKDVNAVFAAIRADCRNDDVTVIEQGPIDRCAFRTWSIRYVDDAFGAEYRLGGSECVDRMSEPTAHAVLALLRYCLNRLD